MLKSKALPKRIALIEFAASHDECLLTQIHALKSQNCWVLLVTNEIVRERNAPLETLVDEWIFVDHRPKHKRKGLRGAAIGDALIIRRLMRTLKKKHIDKVVFNTAQGGHVRNACLFSLFRKMEFIGVIHTIRKFKGSFTQRVIHLKIKKYFVLGEFLRDDVASDATVISTSLNHRGERNRTLASAPLSHRGIQISSFYPIDFPKNEVHILEHDDKTHIALIGSVETRRKDLEGFVSLIKQSNDEVHFHFLGKADPRNADVMQLKKNLEEIDCLHRVTFYESFLDFDTIDLILRKTSAILPLVHPNTPSAEEYFRHQVPGSMNIALGYHIPLLMHQSLSTIKELQPASIYYSLDNFSEALSQLQSEGDSIRETMKQRKEYSSEYQYKKYVAFIFS